MSQLPNIFEFSIPYSVIGNGAVESVGIVVKQLGGREVLIVTDPGVVQAGLLDKVTQPLAKEEIKFKVFGNCKPNGTYSDVRRLE